MAKLGMETVTTAAEGLLRGGQWEAARHLLATAVPENSAERLKLAKAQAELAVDQDFFQGTDTAPAKLDVLAGFVDAEDQWDFDLLQLRYDYFDALFHPDERTPDTGDLLAARAAELRQTAVDDRRAGTVSFYCGLIEDNLRGDSPKAFPYYSEALALGEKAGDDLLVGFALRHLGDHAHMSGDLELARTQWERSTEVRQAAGHVLGVLAQQILLARLTVDEGDPAAARGIATEVRRWGAVLEIDWLVRQADELLA
ncbi:hypothetical protein [Kribbella deserti]|uniref:Tetratricopeptide repeat protein n=1 Tax=Kribbella deserti TaxID=1926257 RepID=A0ABV6QEI8_9ACTN